MSARKPWRIRTQQWTDNTWAFWIIAPNNTTIARSCHPYTSRRGAINGAAKLMDAWRRCGITVAE